MIYLLKYRTLEVSKACDDIENLIRKSEEVMHIIFGDHCQVICTSEEIIVQEYEHD